MKNPLSFPLLALGATFAAALSVAGCGAPTNAENPVTAPASMDAAPTGATANAAPIATPTPVQTPTPKPVSAASKTGEDERYRVTTINPEDFGPDAPPAMIKSYQAAMAKAHQARPPLALKMPDKVKVVMTTSEGPVTVELDAKAAPLQVKSFVYLAQKGFFDGTSFHRHADLLGNGTGYIIQGGDPLTKNPMAANLAGMGGPGYEIPREKNKLTHQKLVVAAARSKDPNSAGSQFYITQGAVPFLDEGDGYTVFGKVVGGAAAALKLKQGDILRKVKVETPIAPYKAFKASNFGGATKN